MFPQSEYVASTCHEMYLCEVAGNGMFLSGPRGWTVTKEAGSTGLYTVTHNFGNVRYLPVVGTMDEGDIRRTAGVKTRADNYILVITYEGVAPADLAFAMVVIKL